MKYILKIWRTEQDRNQGEAVEETFEGTEDEVIGYAQKQYDFYSYSCVEAYEDIEDFDPVIHISADGIEICKSEDI